MSPRSSAPLTLEFILLGLLEERPMHGYDLFRALHGLEGLALIWRIKQSMLYALLDKLEGQGFVEYKMLPGGAHPPRKDYRPTKAGQAAFHAWRQAPVEHAHEMRQEFLARLYFAQRQDARSALELVIASRSAAGPGRRACRMSSRHSAARQASNTLSFLSASSR